MVFVQIIGTDTGDSTASLILQFEKTSYIINCGEGIQRLCMEHKIRLVKLTSIFLTSLQPPFSNGLMGIALVLIVVVVLYLFYYY